MGNSSPKKDNLAEKIVDLMFLERAFEDNPLTERYISEKFNTSRTPVRDALKTLENDDLIERRKKKGVFLKRPTPKMIAELYELRSVLECFAVRRVVELATDNDIKELEECANRFSEALDSQDYLRMEKANLAFHTKLIELSGNEMLIGMMGTMNIIRKAFQYSYSLRPERQAAPSPYAHHDILDKLKQRDADASEALLKKHIQVGQKRMLEQALGFRIFT